MPNTTPTQKGAALLMVWANVPARHEPDFNRWYNEEHLAERLAVPGVLSAARYESHTPGAPKHLAMYELADIAVLSSPEYLAARQNPTAWTRRASPKPSHPSTSAIPTSRYSPPTSTPHRPIRHGARPPNRPHDRPPRP